MKADMNLPTALKILEKMMDDPEQFRFSQRQALQRVLSRIRFDIQEDGSEEAA